MGESMEGRNGGEGREAKREDRWKEERRRRDGAVKDSWRGGRGVSAGCKLQWRKKWD